MRRMLLVLLIVGVLMLGTCSIIAEAYECGFENQDFSEEGDSVPFGVETDGNTTTDGGGCGGGAGAPG